MTVLRDAAGKEDRHRYNSCCIKGHEYHVRAGLGDDADCCRKKDHEYGVVTDPMFDVDVLQGDSEYQKDAECPCEDYREVFPDDVVPEVLVHEMVGCEQQDKEHYDAQTCKEDVHPVLAQKVDMERGLSNFLRLVRLCMNAMQVFVIAAHICLQITMMVMSMCFFMLMGMPDVGVMNVFCVGVSFSVMMFMAEVAGCEGCYEYRKTDKHDGAFPAEMSSRWCRLVIVMTMMLMTGLSAFMHGIARVAGFVHSAFLMSVLVTPGLMTSVVDEVDQYSDYNCNN